MAKSEGWAQVLCPWLRDKLNQSFPDPAQFNLDKEFMYAALTASVFKKVIAEILQYVEQQKDVLETLNNKKKDKIKNKFQIGG